MAIETKADLLLVDDRRARREALRRGVPIVGTIGVLRVAVRRKLIDGADAAARRLEAKRYDIVVPLCHIPPHRPIVATSPSPLRNRKEA